MLMPVKSVSMLRPAMLFRDLRLTPPTRSALHLILGCLICLAGGRGEAAPAKVGEPIAAGDIRQTNGFYSVVFYYAPKPKKETMATAQSLVQRLLPGITFSDSPTNDVQPPFVGFEEEPAPLKMYPVPEASYFKHSGHGLTDKDIVGFQKTTHATCLVLVAPRDDVWKQGRKFTELVYEYAVATGAYIWDSATRECFTSASWKQKRLDSWPEDGVPHMASQFAIHLYHADPETSYLRAITLGMEKFALPDMVIEQLVGSDNRPAGNLIGLVCQSLAEQPVLKDGGKEVFRLDALKPGTFRTEMEPSLEKGATKEITLALLKGRRQKGDPDNHLLEISFRHGAGKTEDERRQDLLSRLWGSSDSIIGVKHTEEILEASKRARTKLGTLRAPFQQGLPTGSRLLVKAPFARDDEGEEWMWVEVLKWPDSKTMEGLLQNDPFYIRKLKAGAKVKVKTEELFDYILFRADGTSEGNETGQLMKKQGGPKKSK